MRVVIDATQAGNRSGTGRYTYELIRALPRVAPDVELSVIWPAGVLRSGIDPRVRIRESNAGPAARIISGQFEWTEWRWRNVIHFPANFGPMFRQHGLVLTVHDLSFLRHPEWFPPSRAWYYRFMAQRSARAAVRVIADSTATKNDLIALTGIREDRIDVIPLGVSENFQPASPEQIAQARARCRVPENYFLYAGTIEPRKNLVRVVEAWSRIAPRVPHDLVIAGRDGWKTAPVREAAARSPFAARIHFPGFIDDAALPALMSGARAFVWPSLFEGFGLPVLEAMACGTPVVTSNTSSLPEVAGDAAMLCAPEDVDGLAHAMETLAADDMRHRQFADAGLAQAGRFTWRRCAELTIATYRRAAKD